ncbi:MAG TPA: ArsI/CadI family heavy metal resistance metalloenzyme [Acidimicrobiales bacterium]|nr:ArsI/CadI family heavy metal resistance metalloenzyme [Acidimicrobiales bacterium]
MGRVQLALNVSDVDTAVAFYSTLFGAEPAKRRPGYANFALDEPALKLVLIENPGAAGTLNHLGVEMFSTDEVAAAGRRLSAAGLATAEESGTCCYAVQEKVWVNDPDAAPWEIYTVLADADTPERRTATAAADRCGAGVCVTEEAPADQAGHTVARCC